MDIVKVIDEITENLKFYKLIEFKTIEKDDE
jgi:hypothetical protein